MGLSHMGHPHYFYTYINNLNAINNMKTILQQIAEKTKQLFGLPGRVAKDQLPAVYYAFDKLWI